MRIFLANVGTNASDGFAGPLFDNGRFESIPIREPNRNLDSAPGAVRYRDLRSHYDRGTDLLRYTPSARHGQACHYDPEFATRTYGDNTNGGRGANLKHMQANDVLLFLARLQRWTDGERTQEFGFYLLGGLHIEEVYAYIAQPPSGDAAARIAKNAHVIRARCMGDWDKFHVFTGSERSRRFERAVPVTRKLCDAVLRNKGGQPYNWPTHRSELSVIGSYTRTCRCVLDTGIPEQAQRAATLREWIAKHSGDADAALLAQ